MKSAVSLALASDVQPVSSGYRTEEECHVRFLISGLTHELDIENDITKQLPSSASILEHSAGKNCKMRHGLY